MNHIYLSVINANNFNKCFAIDTEYLLRERPWDVGQYGIKSTLFPEVNMSYDAGSRILYVYMMFSYGGNKMTHLINGQVELFRVSPVSKYSYGVLTMAIPSDGVFVFAYNNVAISAGDVVFVDAQAYDPFSNRTIMTRSTISGV
jgi:hypothetical protein